VYDGADGAAEKKGEEDELPAEIEAAGRLSFTSPPPTPRPPESRI
jgi:hypothetical protein